MTRASQSASQPVNGPATRRGVRGSRSGAADLSANAAGADSLTRLRGVLLRINREKGYGFIRAAGGGQEYFVHIHEMLNRGDWIEGTPVTFKPGPVKPGAREAPRALDVIANPGPEAKP
jgi:cold shock CspA family protein